ncbi:MAG TPA: hypothetical protein VFE65_19905 [Pseudonocardia sp.]|nr:hypothetical protein [Pseudonocardia sp.]
MTAIMRRIIITAAGIGLSSVVVAAPANAYERDNRDYQSIGTCGTSVCVSVVADAHHVKSITVRSANGMPGTIRVSWGDFHRTTSGSKRTWDVDDKMGHTRGDSKPLRRSDRVCASIQQLLTSEQNVCVAI